MCHTLVSLHTLGCTNYSSWFQPKNYMQCTLDSMNCWPGVTSWCARLLWPLRQRAFLISKRFQKWRPLATLSTLAGELHLKIYCEVMIISYYDVMPARLGVGIISLLELCPSNALCLFMTWLRSYSNPHKAICCEGINGQLCWVWFLQFGHTTCFV